MFDSSPDLGQDDLPAQPGSDRAPLIVVDDDADDLAVARRCFERANLDAPLVTLESGAALLAYLERAVDGLERWPSVVLLDVKMPSPNGFETLTAIRSDARLGGRVRVMMFSTSNDPRDLRRSIELEADGYMTKPMALSDYVDMFRSLIV